MANDHVERPESGSIRLCSDGVYVVEKSGALTKIAEPINVTAYAVSRPDGVDHRILEVVLRDGRTQRLLVKASELVVRPAKFIGKVADMAYLWPERQAHRRRLIEALSAQNPNQNVYVRWVGKGPDDWRELRDDEPLPPSLSPALTNGDLVLRFAQRIVDARKFTLTMMQTATAPILKVGADLFLKKNAAGKIRVYLLSERLDGWFRGERRRLVRLLNMRKLLYKGRSGNDTNTIVIQVKGEAVNCYKIKYRDIIALVGGPPELIKFESD